MIGCGQYIRTSEKLLLKGLAFFKTHSELHQFIIHEKIIWRYNDNLNRYTFYQLIMLKTIKIWYCWITKHLTNTVRCMMKIWSPAKTTSTYCAWLNNVKWPSLNYPSCKISIVLYKHLCWTEQHHQHSKKIEVHSMCCFLNGLLTL